LEQGLAVKKIVWCWLVLAMPSMAFSAENTYATELFDEVASHCQIGKAPAVKDLPLPRNRTSVM
jgi:hypothetical protein